MKKVQVSIFVAMLVTWVLIIVLSVLRGCEDKEVHQDEVIATLRADPDELVIITTDSTCDPGFPCCWLMEDDGNRTYHECNKHAPEPIIIDAMGREVSIGVREELVDITTDPISDAPPVWGKGELPADYVSFFGTDNAARLNKAQNDMLNRHQAVIHGLDQTEDGKTVHINGLVDMVLNLQRRVDMLEAVDPNDVAK